MSQTTIKQELQDRIKDYIDEQVTTDLLPVNEDGLWDERDFVSCITDALQNATERPVELHLTDNGYYDGITDDACEDRYILYNLYRATICFADENGESDSFTFYLTTYFGNNSHLGEDYVIKFEG